VSAVPDSGIATLAPVGGLDVSLSDGLLSVTIDRPDSLNSLTIPVFRGQSVLLRSHDFVEGAMAFQRRRTPNFADC
jgi:enoyl-CoA hydratase/carnithine racemase